LALPCADGSRWQGAARTPSAQQANERGRWNLCVGGGASTGSARRDATDLASRWCSELRIGGLNFNAIRVCRINECYNRSIEISS
jgi:hypothetical protein